MSIEESQAPLPASVSAVTYDSGDARRNVWQDEENTEAQEVASAYLGGSVDDHDGLLSSVLVKECVSHFVESTRVAGDGAGEVSAVQEFQSLHPYFGRCEYARAFWFRFTASEENATKDNGYGYRFQVKPMVNIRWTKESEVLASPSLEWACWVLELLLNDATEVQLLHHPELFPSDEVPELDALESISRLALARAEVDRASVIETSHPYAPGVPLTGLVAFEAAQALRITFDSRCSLASGQGQATVNALGITKEKQLARATAANMEQLLQKLVLLQASPDETSEDGLRCSQLLSLSLESLQLRFALFKYFNLSLQHCLPLLDLRDTKSPWTIANRLRRLSHCIFFDVKKTSTGNSQQTARITLDRMQALESRDDREVEPSVSECFFAQAFRQLHQVDPALLRRQIDSKGRLFSVKFRGEEGVDWGGVYREGATSMVDDLFSPHFSLFVLCPNGQHDTGNNRGMYLPNPKCTSPVAMQMFAFVGQLLGMSLRTHGDFPFMLPSLVWKQLLGQTLTRADLEGTDAMFIQMLDGIANCENDGISTEEEFATAFDGLELRFTASSCTGEEIELVPGGHLVTVAFHNRLEYCRLAERARLEECSAQVAAMAQGFATLFPRRVLTLLTWQELEMLTCGSPKIDLDLWQRHTRYDGYSEDDPTVLLFWDALADFSDEQRADFVRFAWGRSRLPRGKWPQPFKLSKKGGRDATRSLPVAHTCFFSVELPPYTSRETMRSMLIATITFGLGGILMA
uniref:HECT domain-containing protein n=1 Tax=Phytophthora ramorum TaxID=164328 RepID=H3HC41_PHYRM